ncbi:MAG: CoA pyrophosphatase [Prolixibacteraceae bacterium]|jgi:8-oxo-dGTP pyrophosphatase MutT (NUDIX family)
MYSSVKAYLIETLRGDLPGSEAHSKMLPPGRRLKTYDHELSLVKQSSVLILLFREGNQLYTCLMKRPPTMKYHPGQISFPGGKVEKDDLSAEMTALREAQEEVGIDPLSVEILGKLTDLYVEVSQFSIQPFIGWTDKMPDFSLNCDEVEALVLLPLNDFVALEIVSETEIPTVSGLLTVKYYPFQGEIIWGATAMILSELVEILKRREASTDQPLFYSRQF